MAARDLRSASPVRFYLHEPEFEADGVLSVWSEAPCHLALARCLAAVGRLPTVLIGTAYMYHDLCSRAEHGGFRSDSSGSTCFCFRYDEFYSALSNHSHRTMDMAMADIQFLGIDVAMEINYPNYCVRYCDEAVHLFF